jgi:hypothetical protein
MTYGSSSSQVCVHGVSIRRSASSGQTTYNHNGYNFSCSYTTNFSVRSNRAGDSPIWIYCTRTRAARLRNAIHHMVYYAVTHDL